LTDSPVNGPIGLSGLVSRPGCVQRLWVGLFSPTSLVEERGEWFIRGHPDKLPIVLINLHMCLHTTHPFSDLWAWVGLSLACFESAYKSVDLVLSQRSLGRTQLVNFFVYFCKFLQTPYFILSNLVLPSNLYCISYFLSYCC
jgi:hypothetical protein